MKQKKAEKKTLSENFSFRRIVLKVTGESLGGVGDKGFSEEHLHSLAEKLIKIGKSGLQAAIVIGGGNILRGANLSRSKSVRPFAAHQMGMIATTINGLALYETLNSLGQPAELLSAFNVGGFVREYSVKNAMDALEGGKIVILAGGTGSPFVTTDTCAAIRSAELGADALFKATKVDGVFSDDPMKNPEATRFAEISYDKFINDRLAVLDLTAVRICQESKVPIVVFNFDHLNKITKAFFEKVKHTVIH